MTSAVVLVEKGLGLGTLAWKGFTEENTQRTSCFGEVLKNGSETRALVGVGGRAKERLFASLWEKCIISGGSIRSPSLFFFIKLLHLLAFYLSTSLSICLSVCVSGNQKFGDYLDSTSVRQAALPPSAILHLPWSQECVKVEGNSGESILSFSLWVPRGMAGLVASAFTH